MTHNTSRTRLLLLTPLLVVGFAACGGGGGSRLFTGGKLCALSPEPLSLEVEKAEKVSLKPEDKGVLDGEYRYVNSEIFLKNRDTGLQIHATQVLNERRGKGSPEPFVSSVQCVRGFAPETKPFNYEVDVVGQMTARPDGTFQVKLKPIKIGFSDRLDVKFDESIDSDMTHPGKVYEKSATNAIFYRTSEKDLTKFELRSLHEDGPIQIIVVVRFERVTT